MICRSDGISACPMRGRRPPAEPLALATTARSGPMSRATLCRMIRGTRDRRANPYEGPHGRLCYVRESTEVLALVHRELPEMLQVASTPEMDGHGGPFMTTSVSAVGVLVV